MLKRPYRNCLGLLLAVATAGCTGPGGSASQARLVEAERLQMGTRFHIQVVATDGAAAERALDAAFAEVDRLEALLSEWRESSEISAVNRAAGGEPVPVGRELFELVERSIHLSERTGGAFDITFAACGRLWSFREPRLPDADALRACLQHVDYRGIELDPERSTVRLPSSGARIGISAIGKGYGVDRAAAELERRGIEHYIVDGGGDIRLRGRRIDRPWSVGIAHPRAPGSLLGRVRLERGAIVTSGDYQRSFERDGEIYHHILDPATGMPARRSVAVTVLAPTAADADALATGLFVLGPDRGLELVEQLPGVEALLVGPDISLHRSTGFPELD
jgi:thiamine biosynthesis lipoprotein